VVSEIPRPCKTGVRILLQTAKGFGYYLMLMWNLKALCHCWRFFRCSEIFIFKFYALNTQGDHCDDQDLTSACSFFRVKGAPNCKYLNGFVPMCHEKNGGPAVFIVHIRLHDLISYMYHIWLSLCQLHTLSFDKIFPCLKVYAALSKEFMMKFQKKQLKRKEYEALIFEVCYRSAITFPSDKVFIVGDLGVVDFDVNELINLVKRWVETTRMCYQLSFYYGNFCWYKGYFLWTEHAQLKMHGHKVFNESYGNYGSLNKAYKLFHDMEKRDMAVYSLMSQGSRMNGNTTGSTGLVVHMVSKGFDFNYTTYTGFCIGEPLDIATSLIHVSNKTYYVVLVQFLSAYPSYRVGVTNVEITRMLAYQA